MSEHGYGRYTTGCRCDVCREAKATYMRAKRSAWRTKRQTAEADGQGRHFVPGITHGVSGYQDHGCRCWTCRVAKSAAYLRETRREQAAHRHRVDPTDV